MNRNNHDDAYTALALLMTLLWYAYEVIAYSKSPSEPKEKYQEPKTASNSISSEYVKEESELEKSLVTSEISSSSECVNEESESEKSLVTPEVPSSSEEMISYDEIDSSMYFGKDIGYVNSEKFGSKFYLFDYDSETKTFKEVNGLFTFDSWEINSYPVWEFLSEEESEILFGRQKGNIRTVNSILNDLNRKYANKSNEEILKQVKEDANNNLKYETIFVKFLVVNKNDENIIMPTLYLGNGIFYEINGHVFWTDNDVHGNGMILNSLRNYIYYNDDDGKYSSFDKEYLSVEEINAVTALINQEEKQKLNGKSRSLTK